MKKILVVPNDWKAAAKAMVEHAETLERQAEALRKAAAALKDKA